MSDFPQGADWWKDDDGRWYPPEAPKAETSDGNDPSSPPEPDGGWSSLGPGGAVAKPAAPSGSSSSGCLWIVGVVIGIAILAAMCSGGGGGGDDEGGSGGGGGGGSTDPELMELSAFNVCKDFVKDRLRAPGTASFRNFFEDDGEVQVSGTGSGPYTVRSSVDSENGFGANVRTNFVCEVRNTGGENWRLVNLNVLE